MDFIPDAERLAKIFSNAIAPAFFLGAVAAFVSLMTARLSAVHDRIKGMMREVREDAARESAGLARLARRAKLLNAGIIASLSSGICATALLAVLFASQLFGLQHAYGAPLLFIVATLLLGFALLRFAQEAWLVRGELEQFPPD